MSMMKIEVIDRRTFLIGAGASAATLAALSNLAHATPDQAAAFLAKLTGGAVLGDLRHHQLDLALGGLGATVPTEVSADSPMTEKDYCKSISIISTKNPKPHICTFHFTPRSGKAVAKIRVRMAETQEVWAVAQMSDGKWYIGKTTVKVTIGGCGG